MEARQKQWIFIRTKKLPLQAVEFPADRQVQIIHPALCPVCEFVACVNCCKPTTCPCHVGLVVGFLSYWKALHSGAWDGGIGGGVDLPEAATKGDSCGCFRRNPGTHFASSVRTKRRWKHPCTGASPNACRCGSCSAHATEADGGGSRWWSPCCGRSDDRSPLARNHFAGRGQHDRRPGGVCSGGKPRENP